MRCFYVSFIIAFAGLFAAYQWGGVTGLWITALLSLMEVTLSFDNAVVNAVVLKGMDSKWQQRFLTWGILIAVFGMRLLFPLVIVGFATGLPMIEVGQMALNNPDEYSRHVLDSHIAIAAFGGMFLLMVFLHYFFDENKDLHWLAVIEAKLARLGKLESVEVIMALSFLLLMQQWLPPEDRGPALTAGVVGVVLFVAVTSITSLISSKADAGPAVARSVGYSGFMGFMYLNILDASFSLDGVIGAFAISKDIVIIMLGLGIGAFFVRSLTVYMVRKGVLDQYVFLEHGAHYGIGALAAIMIVSMVVHVSEVITGLVGATFVVLSFISSVRYNRRRMQPTQ